MFIPYPPRAIAATFVAAGLDEPPGSDKCFGTGTFQAMSIKKIMAIAQQINLR